MNGFGFLVEAWSGGAVRGGAHESIVGTISRLSAEINRRKGLSIVMDRIAVIIVRPLLQRPSS
jgi:hypothetical protein